MNMIKINQIYLIIADTTFLCYNFSNLMIIIFTDEMIFFWIQNYHQLC